MKGIVLERLKKYCSQFGARIFDFSRGFGEGAGLINPVTESKRSEKSKRPLLQYPLPNGYSSFLTALIPIVALFFATGCDKSGSSSPGPGTNAAANATNADNVPYYGAMIKAQRNAGATADVASLRPSIEQFQVDKGRFPKDLNELVQEKYLSKIPAAPYGMKIDYDPATGTVKVVSQ